MADLAEAGAPIWREAVRLNKNGTEREKLLAYAALCDMYGNRALDAALDCAGRIYDPSAAGFENAGSWFAVAAVLRDRAEKVGD